MYDITNETFMRVEEWNTRLKFIANYIMHIPIYYERKFSFSSISFTVFDCLPVCSVNIFWACLTSFQIWTKMNRESGHTGEISQEMHCMGGKWSLRFLNDWNYGGILTLQEVVIKKRGLRVKSSSCCVSDSFFLQSTNVDPAL